MLSGNNILIQIKRNNITEKAYLGMVIALDSKGNKILDFEYNNSQNIIFRSMQKPFQAYSFMLSGAYEKYDLSPKHLAVISGSHAGTYSQTELVKSVLKKAGIKIKDLKCPKDYPLDEKTKLDMIRKYKPRAAIYDNCSGKHAAMLAACKACSLDIENYTSLNHPIQQKIIAHTLKLCEFDSVITATDGCGVPVLAMPIEYMAKGLQNLYKTVHGKKIISACIRYPMLFGGENRFDTQIIRMTRGKVFAKVGAAGLVGALNLQTSEVLIVKIFADDHAARAEVTIDYMKKLGWL